MNRQKAYKTEEQESFEIWKQRHDRMLGKERQPVCE
jgi:hypothetical protein